MNKVINGRWYDTETANEICRQGSVSNDEHLVILFRKTTGEFFFYNTDGYISSIIEPCSIDEAQDFVAANCSGDCYKELFGEVAE